eukprot:TRINITY_DN2525_c0_g1_i1.p1 TRINITY_DN2525_c0_g1~~TRINITY_DN2525_c0_g1_i1.p1  ORF type:complete len:750 (+),score=148.24 TRINITY_DN2525_c0_g1_i1:123-2372(+)
MGSRCKVEDVFRSRFPGEGTAGSLARADYARMLKEAGLKPAEVDDLLRAWDPAGHERLPFKSFLDFVYDQGQWQAHKQPSKDAGGGIVQASATETIVTAGATKGGEEAAVSEPEPEQALSYDRSTEQKAATCKEDKDAAARLETTATTVAPSTPGGADRVGSHEPPGSTGPESAVAEAAPSGGGGESEEVALLEQQIKAAASKEKSKEAAAAAEEAPADAVAAEAPPPPLPSPPAETEVAEEEEEETTQAVPEDVTPRTQGQCVDCMASGDVYQDPMDLKLYCRRCWIEYYCPPTGKDGAGPPFRLTRLVRGDLWTDDQLRLGWARTPIFGWPPRSSPHTPVAKATAQVKASPLEGEDALDVWFNVKVRVIPDLVGSHARESSRGDRPYIDEVLCGRYKVQTAVGAGHFTRAMLATDLTTGQKVCVKRHNGLSVETLTDLCALGKRLEEVDPESACFPKLLDAFFDMSGYTVEALVEGRNCLEVSRANPDLFAQVPNLQYLARHALHGLTLLAKAGVVHCDLKADNIMWTEDKTGAGNPAIVRIVDFGCARLDSRIESGRNWALAEGGAGHLGKWAPEMVLRLPVTHKADVWGLAVALLELHSAGAMWSCEQDTVEVVLAQALGLIEARDGLPRDLMRRSPLDITRLYSPAPQHFPIRRMGGDSSSPYEELRPATWGLEVVLGKKETWDELKQDLADFVKSAMTCDHAQRPAALDLMEHRFIRGPVPDPPLAPPEDDDAPVPPPPKENV